ncbi:MAG TPA: chromosomal replication initiator protein DnaA [Candidatus Saccharimonadales bacterium]|nr:chromosomal replication initiator protein DnaA [Candidatus Saccharimonadales bacterium]
MDHRGLWQAVLGELEINVSRASFSTWFKHTAIIAQEDGHIIVAVPNIFTKEWLENKYGADIKSALARMSPGIESVEYKVSSKPAPQPAAIDPLNAAPTPVAIPEVMPAAPSSKPITINPKYTLESFVVGGSNELAYAACQAVAKNPGGKYNPLFIYGGVGLGKTHLVQAVGNEILRRDPSKRIEYVTSEQFTSEFISSVSSKKTKNFAEKYRGLDVLIVDDIQFLGNKEKTQEEFFHTFNTLHQQNKQIIMSSDKSPKLIPHLEERLRSRFEWGMTADIQSPDLETRSAILQAKASRQGFKLSSEVIDYLARHFQSNIRELEGALTQLLAYCEFRGAEPSIATVTSLLGNITASGPKRKPPTPKLIIEKTADYFDISADDILGAKRDKEIVVPRQIAMYIMRHELGLSFPKIASCVGGRDHTTAMHSVGKIEKLLEVDEDLRGELSRVKERIIL